MCGDHATAPVATFQPSTINATDLQVCSAHYDTVVHYVRMLDPQGYERTLAGAKMFPADEFVEETTLVAA